MIHNNNANGDDDDGIIISRPDKTTGICNVVTLAPFIWTGRNKRKHENTYYDAVAAALAMQHLNLGDGSLVKKVSGLNETCNIKFTTEFIATEAKKNVAVYGL